MKVKLFTSTYFQGNLKSRGSDAMVKADSGDDDVYSLCRKKLPSHPHLGMFARLFRPWDEAGLPPVTVLWQTLLSFHLLLDLLLHPVLNLCRWYYFMGTCVVDHSLCYLCCILNKIGKNAYLFNCWTIITEFWHIKQIIHMWDSLLCW